MFYTVVDRLSLQQQGRGCIFCSVLALSEGVDPTEPPAPHCLYTLGTGSRPWHGAACRSANSRASTWRGLLSYRDFVRVASAGWTRNSRPPMCVGAACSCSCRRAGPLTDERPEHAGSFRRATRVLLGASEQALRLYWHRDDTQSGACTLATSWWRLKARRGVEGSA